MKLNIPGKTILSNGSKVPCTPHPRRREESGIALFMVIAAVGLLAILTTDLSFLSQMNSRLAFNYVDGLRAEYLAKAAFRLSMVRLKAYAETRKLLNNPAFKEIKAAIPADAVDKIWDFPFLYPMPVPPEASYSQRDTIKSFFDKSALKGSFTAGISSEGTKLNLNNLLIHEIPKKKEEGSPAPEEKTKVNFQGVLEPTLSALLDRKKLEDQEFGEIYRNVSGKDLIDAIIAYLTPGVSGSNLPGFKAIRPKNAPFYSLSELHLIPGIDDRLYALLEDVVTVNATMGINVNKIAKPMFWGLFSQLTEEEVDDILRKRDDPDQGKPWASEEEFWGVFSSTKIADKIEDIKKNFAASNLTILTAEESFKIGVRASVGFAVRRLEAYVILDRESKPQNDPKGNPPLPGPPPVNGTLPPKTTGLNLVYWRML